MDAAPLNRLRDLLVAMAEEDPHVVGAAFIGSRPWARRTGGPTSTWSWPSRVPRPMRPPPGPPGSTHLGVDHHWDLPTSDDQVIRLFLLADGVEVDVAFVREAEFGARGPQWKTLFGTEHSPKPFPDPALDTLVGLAWHHARHARVCLERGRLWQAEHWVGALRAQVISLACLRLGLPTVYAKGAHRLPASFTTALGPTLVRAPTTPEVLRALFAVADLLAKELDRSAPEAADRLRPHLMAWSSP